MTRGKKKKKATAPDGVKIIARNRKARFNYHIVSELEAGLVLQGTEVKSLRDGKIQLVDAYANVEKGEAFLYHAHISEYANGTWTNHDPVRPRKLLLHKREIERLRIKIREKGLTLIPLEIYFNKKGRAKVTLGLCRGKASHDKRATIRDRDERRAAEREED